MGKKMTLEDVRDWLRRGQALMKGYDDKASACYKERADAIDAHLAIPAQTVDVEAWIRTQERLPASGALVLAYYLNSANRGRTVRAHYAAPKSEEAPWENDFGEYDEATDTYWCPEGWYETNENEETHWMIVETVTHWMPLPNPPESKP